MSIQIREAVREDVPEILSLLVNDKLGRQREICNDPLPTVYFEAFDRINQSSIHELLVMEAENKKIIGTLQITYLQYLTYQGGLRAQIEAVRVSEEHRGKGIGRQLIDHAIRRSKDKGAHLIQLTTDKKRSGSLAFYEKLGFLATHHGMKMHF